MSLYSYGIVLGPVSGGIVRRYLQIKMHVPRLSSPFDVFLPFWLVLSSFVRRERGSIVVTSGTADAAPYDDTAQGKSSEKPWRMESNCKEGRIQ
jgi:hypothetical protein